MQTKKYVSIKMKLLPWVFLLFVLNVVMGGAVWYNISIQKDDGLLINLAGRQRMLSQKMTKEILSYKKHIGTEIEAKEKKMTQNTIKLFDKTLNAFVNGGDVPTTLDANGKSVQIKQISNKAILQQFKNVQSIWNEFKTTLNTILNNPKAKIDFAKLAKNIQVLKSSNKAVGMMQKTLEDKNQMIIKMIVALIILATIFFVLTIIVINKAILTPLYSFQSGLTNFFDYLNKTTSQANPIKIYNNDEIGNMTNTVNQNILKIQQNIEDDKKVIDDTISVLNEFEQGNLYKRVKVTSSNPALQQLTKLLNQMADIFEKNIENILTILNQYSNNNYENKVDTKGIKEHLLKLANGVNTLGEAITTMLVENKQNGLTLQNSSNTLLDNVSNLSSASNQAAASLEETATALEEITSNIANNTQNVIQMASYGNEVKNSISKGQKLATHTTTAMDEINEEVTSISEAIAIIDQIAFQTNILSLNAAVEAATAGEAGKGFAVVAQEVRNLASRSAEAANEIKAIVQNATDKANNGKNIASQMIDGYTHLNESITKTLELISGIENASQEQSSGIEQINNAIGDLDQQTQQNAAIAITTKDIAETVQGMAKNIVDEVDKNQFIGK